MKARQTTSASGRPHENGVPREPVTWRETPPVLLVWALLGLLGWAGVAGLVWAARALGAHL